jgi:hypothetical protein
LSQFIRTGSLSIPLQGKQCGSHQLHNHIRFIAIAIVRFFKMTSYLNAYCNFIDISTKDGQALLSNATGKFKSPLIGDNKISLRPGKKYIKKLSEMEGQHNASFTLIRISASNLEPSLSSLGNLTVYFLELTAFLVTVASGMVQAWVGQKTCKRDILRVFMMSLFCSGTLIPREPRHFRSRSLYYTFQID